MTTLAGSALSLGTKDGTNSAAQFTDPFGIAVDAATNLYVVDSGNHTIRKATPAGPNWVVRTLAGVSSQGSLDGTKSEARFFQPNGIATDNAGTFYVGDSRNNTIRKIARQGSDYVVTTVAGNTNTSGSGSLTDGTNTNARFSYPQGLALDSAGNLYVADSMNNAIRKITPVGTNWVTSTLSTRFYQPNAIALDAAGNVYVADNANHTIRKLAPSGMDWVVSTVAGLEGTPGTADGTNASARFYYPNGVALDAQGNIFVADSRNYAIRQITPMGTNWVVTTIAGLAGVFGGTVDGTNRGARFMQPLGVAVDNVGNVYVSEFYALRKITRSGTDWVVTTIRGAKPSFFQPNALAVDNVGNLYVTDTGNNVIRVGQPLFSLRSTRVGGQVVLSWSSSARDYVLEASPALDNAAWIPATNGVTISGGDFVVTNGTPSASAFYRLHKQ